MKSLNIYMAIVLMATFPFWGYAQETDSISPNKTGRIIGIAIPAAMITYGTISLGNNGLRQFDYAVRDDLLEDNALWNKKWDDYLMFSPAVAAFGMKLCGVQSIHQTKDMVILYTLSNVLNLGIVGGTKFIVCRKRPDNHSGYQSFPSGHTAAAFAAAEFLHQEYKNQSVWISADGYSMASLIGVSRIYNNKHWISDVVAGAGIGILSTKAVYWVYPCLQRTVDKKGKETNAVILPSYDQGNWEVNFSCSF